MQGAGAAGFFKPVECETLYLVGDIIDGCVFRSIVTDRFGIVTAEFGNVTDRFGDVTDGVLKAA